MRHAGDSGKWWVSLNGQEVFRGHSRGPAISYASSLALVSVFEHRRSSIEVHGPLGVVWRYEESDLSLSDAPFEEESIAAAM